MAAAATREVFVPEVRLEASDTCAAGDQRLVLGPSAIRALGVRPGDPVLVTLARRQRRGVEGRHDPTEATLGREQRADVEVGRRHVAPTWTFLVRRRPSSRLIPRPIPPPSRPFPVGGVTSVQMAERPALVRASIDWNLSSPPAPTIRSAARPSKP